MRVSQGSSAGIMSTCGGRRAGLIRSCRLKGQFREMVDCFLRWHAVRYAGHPWFFPGSAPSPALGRAKERPLTLSLSPDGGEGIRPGERVSGLVTIARAVGKQSLGHALRRACESLGMAHVTPHGCRAYYVTMRRRQGATDAVIASEIGDRTVSLIAQTYGDLPGGEELSFLPASGLPAWQLWRSRDSKIEEMPRQLSLL